MLARLNKYSLVELTEKGLQIIFDPDLYDKLNNLLNIMYDKFGRYTENSGSTNIHEKFIFNKEEFQETNK